jgi:ferrous iron transport protein A
VKKRSLNMPLSMAEAGQELYIKKVGGNEDSRHFLESLGFVAGSMVKVISVIGGNMIVQIKESRVAVSREMANRIIV